MLPQTISCIYFSSYLSLFPWGWEVGLIQFPTSSTKIYQNAHHLMSFLLCNLTKQVRHQPSKRALEPGHLLPPLKSYSINYLLCLLHFQLLFMILSIQCYIKSTCVGSLYSSANLILKTIL